MSSVEQPKRSFPPLHTSSGNPSVDRLAFFHILERLKTQKRTGWVNHNVPGPESISDHMYRMAVLAMCTSDERLDISKCVMMCLVHDLAEAQVGDIAPSDGIPRTEKKRLEEEAMHNFVHEMLHNSPSAQRIMVLWQEYEQGLSAEARFVKGKSIWISAILVNRLISQVDLDRFEMALQAFEYEKNHGMKTLQTFFDSSLPSLKHLEVQEWGGNLATERERLHQVKSITAQANNGQRAPQG